MRPLVSVKLPISLMVSVPSMTMDVLRASYVNTETWLGIGLMSTVCILYEFEKQPSRGVLRKRSLKICSKFTEEQPCRSVISIKLQSNFIEITLRHRCSPVNLLHTFRTPFPKNSSGRLLLEFALQRSYFNFFSKILHFQVDLKVGFQL